VVNIVSLNNLSMNLLQMQSTTDSNKRILSGGWIKIPPLYLYTVKLSIFLELLFLYCLFSYFIMLN